MMSISTDFDVRSRLQRGDAFLAVLGVDAPSCCALEDVVSAKMLRTSSSTISTLRPASIGSLRWSCSSIRRFASGRSASTRCRNSAVSSSSRSGELASLMMTASASRFSSASSCLVSCFAGVDDDRQLPQPELALDPGRSARSRSCPAGRGRAPCSRTGPLCRASSASSPVATAVVCTSPLPISSTMLCAARSSSSTTSSRFTGRSTNSCSVVSASDERLLA